MVHTVQGRVGQFTKIHFIAIKPSPSRWERWPAMNKTNEMISAVCEGDPLLHYADIASPMLGEDGTPRTEMTCRLADLQTCRLADLQTCRLACILGRFDTY